MANNFSQNIKSTVLQHGTAVFVNSQAILHNINYFVKNLPNNEIALVLKNNAYGVGIANVFNIVKHTTNTYFVATLQEGIDLRKLSKEITIYILNGILPTQTQIFLQNNLYPVINTLSQLNTWQNLASGLNKILPAILQVETGLNRVGLTNENVDYLSNNLSNYANVNIQYVLSHLACGEMQNHYSIDLQHNNFNKLVAKLPKTKHTFSASSGAMLMANKTATFNDNLIRLALAIYGGNALPYLQSPLQNAVHMYSSIVQVKDVPANTGVGYTYSHITKKPTTIATIPVGYADGIIKSAKNTAEVFIAGKPCKIIGNISMDFTTIDITHLSDEFKKEGTLVEVYGDNITLSQTSTNCGTNGCEILNILTKRYPVIFV